jgi:hypothetical protein
MTQMDTLLTARAQPSLTLHRKPDTDAQSDEAAQFVEVWSVQADEAVAKNAAQFLIRDSLLDADVAKTAIATLPENTQTPVPQSQSKNDVLHSQVTGPAAPNVEIPGVQNDAAPKAAPDNTVQGAVQQAQTRHQNAQHPVPKTELHSSQSSSEGGNWTAEKPAEPEQIKTAPQLLNPQHPLLSVDEKNHRRTRHPPKCAPNIVERRCAVTARSDSVAQTGPNRNRTHFGNIANARSCHIRG